MNNLHGLSFMYEINCFLTFLAKKVTEFVFCMLIFFVSFQNFHLKIYDRKTLNNPRYLKAFAGHSGMKKIHQCPGKNTVNSYNSIGILNYFKPKI